LPADVPCLPGSSLSTTQSGYDDPRGCQVSRWPFSSGHLWTRTIYCRLSRAGVACRYRPGVVPKVSCSIHLWIHNYLQYLRARCDAKPDNLDAGGARLRSQIKTELLINSWDPGILWTDFGVRADIIVSLLANMSRLHPKHTSIAFHIQFPKGRHLSAFIS